MARDADYIKAILVEKIFRKLGKKRIFLGTEIPFLSNKRKVDILAIYKNNSYAFEIKSKKDSLRKLPEQLMDYLRVFDYVNIVLDEKFIDYKILQFLPSSVGIISFIEKANKLIVVRKAKMNRKVNKKFLTKFVNVGDMKKLFFKQHGFDFINKEKYLRNKFTKQKLKELAFYLIKTRYSSRYNRFLQETYHRIHVEDLEYLTKDFDIALE